MNGSEDLEKLEDRAFPQTGSLQMLLGARNLKIVLFVRHAEAIHNVADAVARRTAIDEGRSAEEARIATLKKPEFLDAGLSPRGVAQSFRSRKSISRLISSLGLSPSLVITSPLKRCTQTTEIIFGDNADVVVETDNLVRERMTGRPCDFLEWEFKEEGGKASEDKMAEEDNINLQTRCSNFLDRLKAIDGHQFIVVVSHKAFLRELDNELRNHWAEASTVLRPGIYQNTEARLYCFDFAPKTLINKKLMQFIVGDPQCTYGIQTHIRKWSIRSEA